MEDDYLRSVTRLNPAEIDALARHYWHDVWQYAYFLTRREHLAEDITVKSRLHRARTKLAKLMKEAGSDVETDLG